MKSKFIPSLICLLGLIFCMVNGCASTASNTEKGTTGSYFTGSGGQEIRLGILVPQSQGLNEKDYIPAMVQGVLVANMRKYSAISVLDRVSLDRVITETLNPTYEDNFDIVRLGHVAQVGYMMTGNIIRTSSGYSMQINVTDTTPNANTIASYSGNFSVAQFDDYTAINRASIDLLSQMGVALTAAAKNELGRASPRQDITAQTAMAQGIVAQRKGQTVEAILHYFDATALESIATEALSRMSMATTTIATGSLGNQIRNDIEQRKEWVRLIEETRKYFANNPQYALAELYFSPKLDLTSINYTAETATLSFPVQVRLNTERANAVTKIVSDIHKGLEATGRRQQWGISVSVDPFLYAYVFDFELVDERGKIISYTSTPRPSAPDLFSIPNPILLYYNGEPQYGISLYCGFGRIGSFFVPNYSVRSFGGYVGRDIYYTTGVSFETIIYNYVVGSLSSSNVNVSHIFSHSSKIPGQYRTVYHSIIVDSVSSNNLSSDGQSLSSSLIDGLKKEASWKESPSFNVKASAITDNLSIRLSNITIYKLSFHNPIPINDKVIKRGNNIIPVRTGTF